MLNLHGANLTYEQIFSQGSQVWVYQNLTSYCSNFHCMYLLLTHATQYSLSTHSILTRDWEQSWNRYSVLAKLGRMEISHHTRAGSSVHLM